MLYFKIMVAGKCRMNASSSKFNTNRLREDLLQIVPQSVMERVLLIMGTRTLPFVDKEDVLDLLLLKIGKKSLLD